MRLYSPVTERPRSRSWGRFYSAERSLPTRAPRSDSRNVRGSEGNPTEWAKEVDQARKLLAPIADIAFYFPFKVGSTMAGKGGLVTSTFAKRNPFYDIFKGWGE